MAAAEADWRANARDEWEEIDFWHWPRGYYRSAWIVAGSIRCNPLEVFDAPTPVARAVNAMLTRQCVIFTIVMTRHTPNLQNPVERLLAWFSASAHNHGQGITDMIEGLASVDWGFARLPPPCGTPARPHVGAQHSATCPRRCRTNRRRASDNMGQANHDSSSRLNDCDSEER